MTNFCFYLSPSIHEKDVYTTVGAEKFTISSLAYTAGLKHMEKNQRLGNFFPNNDQLYRLLRQGMRG